MPARSLLLAVLLLSATAAAILFWPDGDAAPPGGMGMAETPRQASALADLVAGTGEAKVADPTRRSIAPAVDSGARVRLSGRLVDTGNRPVAGQELELLAAKPEPPGDARIQNVGRNRAEFAAAGAIATAADGTFALLPPAGVALRLQPGGSARVFRAGPIELEAIAVDRALGDIVVHSAGSIAGAVRDARGNACPDAVVLCGAENQAFDESAARRAVTDATGRFHFGGLANGCWLVRCRTTGHVPQQRRIELAAEQTVADCDFALQEGESIEGRVVDDLGAPVASADVRATPADDGNAPAVQAQSSADGSFVLVGLAAGRWSLRATATGHKRGRADVRTSARGVVLELARVTTLRGSVVDRQGTAFAGSRVRAVPASQAPEQDRVQALFDPGVLTDQDGQFALPRPAPGTYRVIASGRHLDAVLPAVVVMQGTEVAPLRIVVDRGAVARIAVVDPQGAATAGARVRVVEAAAPETDRPMLLIGGSTGLDPDEFGQHRVYQGTTDAGGMVELHGLPPGEYRATVAAAAGAQERAERFTVTGLAVVVRVQLAAAGWAVIEVVDQDGAPLPDRRIEVDGPLGAATGNRSAVTDAAGRARFGPLLPGRYGGALGKTVVNEAMGGGMLLVTSGPGPVHESTRTEFTVLASSTARLGIVQPPLATLRGVLAEGRGPIPAGVVQVERQGADPQQAQRFGLDGSARSTHTRPDGSFAIAELEPGRYRVRFGRARQQLRAECTVEVPPGQREVGLALLLDCAPLQVSVVRAGDREPVADAWLTLRRQGDPPPTTDPTMRDVAFDASPSARERSDAAGVARFADVPAGRYVMAVTAAHFVDVAGEAVVIEAGGCAVAAALELRPAARITGSVADAAGGEVRSAIVEYRAAAASAFRQCRASNGRFEIDGLEAGDYVLRARRASGARGGQAQACGPECAVHLELPGSPAVALRLPD